MLIRTYTFNQNGTTKKCGKNESRKQPAQIESGWLKFHSVWKFNIPRYITRYINSPKGEAHFVIWQLKRK